MRRKCFIKGLVALFMVMTLTLCGTGANKVFAEALFSDVGDYATVIYQNISVTSGGTSLKITGANEQSKVKKATEILGDAYYTYYEEPNSDFNYWYWYCSQQDKESVMVSKSEGYSSGQVVSYVGPDATTYNRNVNYFQGYDMNWDGSVTYGEYLARNGIIDYDNTNYRCLVKKEPFSYGQFYNSETVLYAFYMENAASEGEIEIEADWNADDFEFVPNSWGGGYYRYKYGPTQLTYVGDDTWYTNGYEYKKYALYYYDESNNSLARIGEVNTLDEGTFDSSFMGNGLYLVLGFSGPPSSAQEIDYSGLTFDTIRAKVEGTMYRMYNPNSGEHFYTANVDEANNLKSVGWNYEGEAWVSPDISDTPVYRLYNPNSGEHHYTTSVGERDSLVSIGWNDEGIGWYSDTDEGTPLYRLYNPNATGAQEAGAHHYTQEESERDYLVSIGWNDEGIGWYGL